MSGREFTFSEHETFVFGRDPSCHVSHKGDSFVSRYHFLLELNPPRARLRDLGSLNGTAVNGKLVGGENTAEQPSHDARELELRDGDRIQAGVTVFQLRMPTPPPATPEMDPLPSAGKPTPKEWRPFAEDPGPPESAHYDVGREAGRGRMGVVYAGRRKSDGRRVALKVVRPRASSGTVMMQFLEREIRNLRQLRHPQIVELLDSHREDGRIVFVMAHCARGSVERLLKRKGKLPLALSIPIMLHVLRGLAHAHEHDYVHRDLRPANILLSGNDTDWCAQIADFGLAKSFDKAGMSGMTATGAYTATLDYMPREQLTDYKYVRPASDVWSAAATFYEMLSGERPRDCAPGEDPIERVLCDEIVPLRGRQTDLPEEVAAVIDQALSTTLSERYPSATEFRAALKAELTKTGHLNGKDGVP